MKFDYWNDRSSGVQRSNPIISVERLDLLGSKQDNEQGGGNMGGGYPDEF